MEKDNYFEFSHESGCYYSPHLIRSPIQSTVQKMPSAFFMPF